MKISNKIPALIILLFLITFTNKTFSQESQDQTKKRHYTLIEIEADYPGGIKAWNIFLNNNLNTNVPGDRGCPAGKYQVLIKFIIDNEGNIDSILPETHNGFGMEEEAMRVIKLSPKWMPAIQNGRKVKAFKRQPITFVVEPEIEEKKTNQNLN